MEKLGFKIYPGNTYILPKSKEVWDFIDTLTMFRQEGYFFSRAYKKGWWDGYFRFRKINKIPTGMYFTLVKPHLIENSIPFEEQMMYETFEPKGDYTLKDIELRDYQKQTVEQALKEKRCVIQLPTNAGKTEVAFALIQAFGLPFLFITHRKELFYQTYERILKRTDLKPGLVGDGHKEFNLEHGMIMMVQTLGNLTPEQKESVLSVPVLVIDECHHYTGQKNFWYKLLSESTAPIRFGLSATPLRDDAIPDWMLKGLTGKVIGDITNEYLIEQGYSTPPEIHVMNIKNTIDIQPLIKHYDDKRTMVRTKYQELIEQSPDKERELTYRMDLILRKIKMAEYQELYSKVTNDDPRRYEVIKEIISKHIGKQILVLVDRIILGTKIKEMNDNSVFLKGNDETEFRRNIIKAFNKCEVKTLVSTLLDEGVDIPTIQVLVFASPMQSLVKVLQRLGRGMRKHESKDKLIVYDLVDTVSKYFVRQSKARLKIYKNEKFQVIQEHC